MDTFEFDLLVQKAEDDLNAGRLKAAASTYEEAAMCTEVNDQKAQAYQMLGIVLRLQRKLDLSEDILLMALLLADSRQLRARIIPDFAMTLMERLRPGDRQLFDYIVELLRSVEEYFAQQTVVTHWIAVAYTGRAEHFFGNRSEAYSLMEKADRGLRKLTPRDPDIELNNLMWLLRTESMRKRFVRLPRALDLIHETSQRRRYMELVIVMIGGDRLYQFTRRHLGR